MVAPEGGCLWIWNKSHDLRRLVIIFFCFMLLCFGNKRPDPISWLVLPPISFSCYLRCLVDCRYVFVVLPQIIWKTLPQDRSVFQLLDWILRYTLFRGFDTLGSHLREEGSLDYDGGFVRLQIQTNFDMHINRQQNPVDLMWPPPISTHDLAPTSSRRHLGFEAQPRNCPRLRLAVLATMRPALDPAGHRVPRTKPTCLVHT
jgi:hypothetical protein